MKMCATAIILLLLIATTAAPQQAPQPMRPYSGIGVLFLATEQGDGGRQEPLNLYEEPAMLRIGSLDRSQAPPYEWLFIRNASQLPLIVMARRGDWLRVAYDDAGRQGWLEPRQRDSFQSWESLLKGRSCRLLPGLRKQQYQVFRRPGKVPLTPHALTKQSFKVVKLEGDWVLVMPDQDTLGWLRWRDEDGRLLISVDMDSDTQKY